ncbi:MAG: 4'-phosphopantetheinyl transferase superfamily protein [Lachnospiraceae bacterium]|nr:4'-phosphopantetheinyl transferase superfamily protein [Lachnospiraceae bacterium]
MKAYIVDYKKLGIDRTWGGLLTYLTEEEREKALRYRFDADKIRSVVGACLIRSAAIERFPGEDITVSKTDKGKPYISGKEGYEFNLSHSGDLIALAVDDRPVGIDVEQIKDKNWEIFHRYLTDAEMSMIKGADNPAGRFYEVWTIREAFSKEEGLGLSILDEEFKVDYDKRIVTYDNKSLHFRTERYSTSDEYRISLCSRKQVDDAVIEYPGISEWDKRIRLLK